jgi:hypothetical protein
MSSVLFLSQSHRNMYDQANPHRSTSFPLQSISYALFSVRLGEPPP